MQKKIWRWGLVVTMLMAMMLLAGCQHDPVTNTTAHDAEPVKAATAPPAEEPVKNGVSVLMYHMIADLANNDAVLAPDHFRAQMQFLKDNGYHPISLQQLDEYIRHGTPLPEKPVCITFDDGYLDNYEIVYPLMKEFGFPWTIFVVTNDVGKSGRVTWEQLKEMHAAGVTVANHTFSHPQTTYLPAKTQREEVTLSQQALAEHLGIENTYFCYPYGLYNNTLLGILQENGITLAVTMDPGRVHVGDDPLTVRRIWIGNRVDLEHFEERLTTDQYRSL
ncbi:polysaccharide deacetylase family protein [Negativicoccus succinicivorans]